MGTVKNLLRPIQEPQVESTAVEAPSEGCSHSSEPFLLDFLGCQQFIFSTTNKSIYYF